MKVSQIGIASAVLVLFSGCSTLASDGKRVDYGAAALQVPALEVPPDLTTPLGDGRYKVPGEVETVATYSDYSKGGAKGSVANTMLPEIQGVHMERNAAQRWLVINDSAENVWAVVKTFWQDLGVPISSEEKAAGVMETNWVENRARIFRGGSHQGFNEEFNNTYIAGERDQYRTRLERSKDGGKTEVYITHHGIQEVVSGSQSTWVARGSDPELEAIMLQRLMVRFGANEAQAASAVAATSVVSATVNVPEVEGKASLREVSGGSTIIVVNDAFDRAWRKVGLAIESAGLAVEDKDREKGIYFLRPVKLEGSWSDKLTFWKNSKEADNRFRVNVKDLGTVSEVSISDQDGASNKVTRQMLDAIFKYINQP
ncbi:MAG: outer membrane protein assembly factor BamC [Nitrosomonadales bacterium]|nr:outer membrane protein assembly factor BamC [Nitrosomonadales bacterium]